jgi:hypothetical protein
MMTTLFIVEEEQGGLWWNLQQVCVGCQLEAAFVVECVELGVADPRGSPSQWQFDANSRTRLLKAWRLHRDLDVHVSGLPLILDLLEEVDSLRQESEHLRNRLQHWEREYQEAT